MIRVYGYIRYSRDEMKVKHIKLYNKYYCLLCTELGKNAGFIYRFLTSYDVTSFMILFDAVSTEEKKEYKISCPISRLHNYTVNISPAAVDFSLFVCLFYAMQKISDNCEDEKNPIWKILNHKVHKNKKLQNILTNDFTSKWELLLKKYYEAEKNSDSTFDELSNLIGAAYGEGFKDFANANGISDKAEKLYVVGFNIGKYIYLMDAYDDYFNDIKKKKFNPITRMYGYESIKDNNNKIKDKIAFITGIIVSKIKEKISEIVTIDSDQSQIFMNIIEYGMLEKFITISNKYSKTINKNKQ